MLQRACGCDMVCALAAQPRHTEGAPMTVREMRERLTDEQLQFMQQFDVATSPSQCDDEDDDGE